MICPLSGKRLPCSRAPGLIRRTLASRRNSQLILDNSIIMILLRDVWSGSKENSVRTEGVFGLRFRKAPE